MSKFDRATQEESLLARQLDENTVHPGGPFSPFLPQSSIDELITEDTIKAVLQTKETDDAFYKRVFQIARKTFAILVLIDKVSFMRRLTEAGFTDRTLPHYRKDERENYKEFNSDELTSSKLLDAWESETVDEFLKKQWLVLAPVFDTPGQRFHKDPRSPLPITQINDIPGSYRLRFRGRIHPAHQQWTMKSQVSIT